MRQYQLIQKKIDQLQGLPVLLKINSEIFGTLATLPVTHTPKVHAKNINYKKERNERFCNSSGPGHCISKILWDW